MTDDQMNDDQIIEVVSARKAGKQIQHQARHQLVYVSHEWRDCLAKFEWRFDQYVYRIKPEPREWWAWVYRHNVELTQRACLYKLDERHLALAQKERAAHGDVIKVREVLE